MSKSSLELLAETIARKAHGTQFRRDGVTPYTNHLQAVVSRVTDRSLEAIATAWLHDTLEDTSETADSLRAAGIPETVIEAVKALTHTEHTPYREYLKLVAATPIAREVKIADMLSNLSDAPTLNQIRRYSTGLLYLTDYGSHA